MATDTTSPPTTTRAPTTPTTDSHPVGGKVDAAAPLGPMAAPPVAPADRRVQSPRRIAAALTELWSPRVIGEVDDAYVKVARVKGSLPWHRHEREDELFLVLAGRLRLELEDGPVDLGEGEMYIVPKGVLHQPIAIEECHVLLVERKSTLHTGDIVTDQTRSIADQLRAV